MTSTGQWALPAGLPTPAGPYSLASVTPEGLIHLSGLIALDAAGNVIGEDDAFAQTQAIFSQARAILEAAGASLSDVVFAHVFVSGMQHYGAMNSAYREAFSETGRPPPPRYCISAGLIKDELLVEIAFVAKKGD